MSVLCVYERSVQSHGDAHCDWGLCMCILMGMRPLRLGTCAYPLQPWIILSMIGNVASGGSSQKIKVGRKLVGLYTS